MSEIDNIAPPLIHGLRDQKKKYQKSWQERVFDLMDFKLDEQPASDETIKAEKGLQIPSSHYCYVMKIHCPFDYIIFIYQLTDNIATGLKGVSPFDSGGLWHNHHVKNGMDESDKQDLFNTYNYTFCEYETHFQKYLQKAYSSATCPPETCYINCEVPDNGWWTHKQLELKESNDKRAWCWEARVPFQHARHVLDLKRIYLSKQAYQQLKKEIFIDEDYNKKYLRSFTELTRHYDQFKLNIDESARNLAIEYLSEVSLRAFG